MHYLSELQHPFGTNMAPSTPDYMPGQRHTPDSSTFRASHRQHRIYKSRQLNSRLGVHAATASVAKRRLRGSTAWSLTSLQKLSASQMMAGNLSNSNISWLTTLGTISRNPIDCLEPTWHRRRRSATRAAETHRRAQYVACRVLHSVLSVKQLIARRGVQSVAASAAKRTLRG